MNRSEDYLYWWTFLRFHPAPLFLCKCAGPNHPEKPDFTKSCTVHAGLTHSEHPGSVGDLIFEPPSHVAAAPRHHRRHPPAVGRRGERVVLPFDLSVHFGLEPPDRRHFVFILVRVGESAADYFCSKRPHVIIKSLSNYNNGIAKVLQKQQCCYC